MLFVAMGLPVVGPAIETLAGIPGVRRFAGSTDFIEAIRETERTALSPEVRREMADFADRNSWVQRVDAMLGSAQAVSVERGRRAGAAGPAIHTKRSLLSVVIPAYNHERGGR